MIDMKDIKSKNSYIGSIFGFTTGWSAWLQPADLLPAMARLERVQSGRKSIRHVTWYSASSRILPTLLYTQISSLIFNEFSLNFKSWESH